MATIHLTASVGDIADEFDPGGKPVDRQLYDIQLWLGNAYNAEVDIRFDDKYVEYTLSNIDGHRANAIVELFGVLTTFNGTVSK